MASPLDKLPAVDPDFGEAPPTFDAPTEDAPPRRGRGRKAANTAAESVTKVRELSLTKVQTEADKVFKRAGTALYFLGLSQPKAQKFSFDGAIIAQNSDTLAKALVQAAEKSPKFRKQLEKMVALSGYGILGGVLIGVTLPMLVHHGFVPKFFGAFANMDPDVPDLSNVLSDDEMAEMLAHMTATEEGDPNSPADPVV